MWAKRAAETLGALGAAKDVDATFEVLSDYADLLGADLVSYHHIAPPFVRATGKPHRENFNLIARGFPDDWLEAYESEKLHRIDPITSYAAYQTRPFLWSSIRDRVRLTPEQESYLERLFSWLSPGDGMAVPAFGPSGRHGYVGIGRTQPIKPWSEAQQRMVQAICESFHLRICELRLAGMEKDFELTEREVDILSGMAQGWSDPMIGAIVNISSDSLNPSIQRILDKMSVTDRPSAVLRAKALRLVDAD